MRGGAEHNGGMAPRGDMGQVWARGEAEADLPRVGETSAASEEGPGWIPWPWWCMMQVVKDVQTRCKEDG